jgi:hypothetical protein
MQPVSIYLMGQISIKAPETHLWRERFRSKFKDDGRFKVIDPCNNEFNRKLLKDCQDKTGDHCTIVEALKVKGRDIIVPKDRMYAKVSDIGIVNLTSYDDTKPLIGTMFELAWYYDSPHKTVIGFYHGKQHAIFTGHPFIAKTVTSWVIDEMDAVEMVKTYFGDMFNG